MTIAVGCRLRLNNRTLKISSSEILSYKNRQWIRCEIIGGKEDGQQLWVRLLKILTAYNVN